MWTRKTTQIQVAKSALLRFTLHTWCRHAACAECIWQGIVNLHNESGWRSIRLHHSVAVHRRTQRNTTTHTFRINLSILITNCHFAIFNIIRFFARCASVPLGRRFLRLSAVFLRSLCTATHLRQAPINKHIRPLAALIAHRPKMRARSNSKFYLMLVYLAFLCARPCVLWSFGCFTFTRFIVTRIYVLRMHTSQRQRECWSPQLCSKHTARWHTAWCWSLRCVLSTFARNRTIR